MSGVVVNVNNSQLSPVQSSSFSVVNYQLSVQQSVVGRWFKDVGGKNNWIHLKIKLLNNRNNLVIGRSVPLIVTLHYQNNKHSPINKKDLFTIENSHLLIIDDESGEVEIKVRIEGVSRTHEHNHFVIKIEPDIVKVPRNSEIGFTFTSPIEVLSKPKLSKKFTTTQQIQQIQEEEKKKISTQLNNTINLQIKT